MPTVEPIPLGPEGSRSLAFVHTVERIPEGKMLGVARWEGTSTVLEEIRAEGNAGRRKSYNVAITDLLRAYGYTVLDEADAIFQEGRTVRVRYQLAGVIHDIELDFQYQRPRRGPLKDETPYRGRGTARVTFELQVYDLVKKETVFQRTYRGTGNDVGYKPKPVVPAVIDAVRHAMADPDFVASVVSRGTATRSTIPATRLKRCRTRPAPLPVGLDDSLDSVVVVHAGRAAGGGVIVSEDGHVITAAHVVGDRKQVYVSLRAGPLLPARVVSRNPARDVALLELPGHGYRCAPTTGSASLPVGSEVFTINILLDNQTPMVTRGVVSGYQEISGRRYIQTDASINAGSSGSPLFDESGQVGGIVTDKVVAVGVEGLGLGVPIDEADSSLRIRWD